MLATYWRETDNGASQLIIDGKIKLKNDGQLSRFTKTGLEFDNGSTLDADAVIFATGYEPSVSTLEGHIYANTRVT
jgi:lysine/ornithine N-monooxygenase